MTKIAEAYGFISYIIDNFKDAEEIIKLAIAGDGPAFVEVKLDQMTCVNPKLVVNYPIEDMSPFIEKEELRKEMLIELADGKEVHK